MHIFEIPYYESLEHIVDTLDNRKNILAVASHGLHCLSLLSRDTDHITAADTSPEQVALNHLYLSSVKNMSGGEFRDTYISPGSREKRKELVEKKWDSISKDIPTRYHENVSDILDNTDEYGSSALIRYSEQNAERLFPFACSEKGYSTLKNKICSGKFNIIHEDTISSISSSDHLDGIYLSNIFEWAAEKDGDIQEQSAGSCSSALRKGGIVYISEIKLHPENKIQNIFFGQDMSAFRSVSSSHNWQKYFDIDVLPQDKAACYNAVIASKD
ncbi:hypothetical protein GF336_01140 [Candidatus Woesearchaeota archaeon]|nr:hypothetical protein [Candidatus Woesearchaeota archaeon]